MLAAGSDSIQLSLNEDLSVQAIGYKLIDGTGEDGTAADGQDVIWNVDDPQIAEVDDNGNLIAKAPGETTVTLTWGAFTATSKVSVTGTGIKLTPASRSIKQTGATIILQRHGMAQRRMTVRQLHGPVLIPSAQQLMIRELLPASVRVQPISLQPGMVFSPNRSRSKSHRQRMYL